MLFSRSGEKTFHCHVCSSAFSTKGSLKVHMRLHTGAKPFKCPHCSQRFRTSGHRKSHIMQHLKPTAPKKHRKSHRNPVASDVVQQMLQSDTQGDQVVANGNQVINLVQNQNVLPVSLSITDSFGNVTDSGVTAQLLQGLEGVQLQLSANIGQSIQITGLEPSSMLQTVQIDAGLLQQLQQQGNINLTINPNLISAPTVQAADPNLVQNIQQAASISDTVNPNVVIQSFAVAPGQSIMTAATDNGQVMDVAGNVTSVHQEVMDNGQALAMDGMMMVKSQEDGDEEESSGQEDEDEEDEVPEGVSEDLQGFDEGPLDANGLKPDEQQQALQLLQQHTSHRMDLTDPGRTHVCPVSLSLQSLSLTSHVCFFSTISLCLFLYPFLPHSILPSLHPHSICPSIPTFFLSLSPSLSLYVSLLSSFIHLPPSPSLPLYVPVFALQH